MAVKKNSKIAIVAASAPPLSSGGVASAHYNLFRTLKQSGHQARLFTFFDNSTPGRRETHIVRNGASPRLVRTISKAVSFIFGLIDPGKPSYQTADILRSSIGAFKMGQAIARFAPDVVILSDHGAPGLWVPKKPGQIFVLVSHHNPLRFSSEPLIGDFSQKDARLAVWLEQKILPKVDSVICPSNYMAKWFRSTYKYSGPVSVISNLVDFELLKRIKPVGIRRLLGISSRSKVVYLPSAGSVLKGSRFVWPVVAKLANTIKQPLGFYMPGEVEPGLLAKLTDRKNSYRFYLPGQVTYERHLALVRECDIGISPALMENLSMAILEAVLLGVPMLAFDRGGNSDIIANGQNGYLIKAFDVNSLVGIAHRLLSSKNLPKFKQSAQNYSRAKFRAGAVLRAYLQNIGFD